MTEKPSAFSALSRAISDPPAARVEPATPATAKDPETTPEMPETAVVEGRPAKKFAWENEEDFTVESLLADQAAATLVVIDTPQASMRITFKVLTENDKSDAEALTAPRMNKFFWNEQVARWCTIAMCAASITHIDGRVWMSGKRLEERVDELRRGRSVAMMDRILDAFHEFQRHTIWLSKELDPKGS